MTLYLQGESASLGASASGSIRIRSKIAGDVTKIMVSSTGRCEVTDIDIAGIEDIFDGVMELDQFREEGNVLPLEEPLTVSEGTDIVFSLTDISGASNDVYVAVRMTKV